MKASLTAVALALVSGIALAAPPKNAPGPTPKPTPDRPVVLGTTQIRGDFGRLGTTYTIGKAEPLNVKVLSAYYTLDRFVVDTIADGPTTARIAPVGKKLLVVRMTVQNPRKDDTVPTLSLTAVTPDGNNSEWPLAFTEKTRSELGKQTLKPGQKIDVLATMVVDGRQPIQKLIVGRGGDDRAAVVRYDLSGKVMLLPKWAGESAEAPDVIAGIRGLAMPAQRFDFGVRGFEWATDQLDAEEPLEGGFRFLVVHLSFYGTGDNYERVDGGALDALLTTTDGEKVGREVPGGVGGFLLARRNVPGGGAPLDKGERADFRIYFKLAGDAVPKTVTLKDAKGSGRTFSFPFGQDWFAIRDCVRSVRGPL